uniref:Glycosyltransferase family 8 protein n=1 Tax=Ditylum brightwellii TaxID=49249 RepID=A0A7S1ZB82_9STRA
MVRIATGLSRQKRPMAKPCCYVRFLLIIASLAFVLMLSLSHRIYTREIEPLLLHHQYNIYQPQPKATIAYAVSLTGCGAKDEAVNKAAALTDGAAVLKHSIHLSSIQNPESGSKYDYKMYAFVHPEAIHCSGPFTKLGYEVLIRDTPVNITEIRGDFLRERLPKSGCCGEKEFIKLYAYTLLDYPVVVHLDLDTLILRPLDDLFDVMIDDSDASSLARNKIPVMHDAEIPKKVDAMFTRDYNSINAGDKHAGVQGGFLVIRPSQEAFDEYVQIILEGNFNGGGWGGQYGFYWGVFQIQGLCAYFYDHFHPETSLELNRCVYNLMADSPREEPKTDGFQSRCLDGKDGCEDCQKVDLATAKTIHFTLCRKPWMCHSSTKTNRKELCKKLHHEWFRVRKDFELTERAKNGNTSRDLKDFCRGDGPQFYVPMEL